MSFDSYIAYINDALFEEKALKNTAADAVRKAMSYSLSCGGKRIRPLLTLLFCEACGGKKEDALAFARAVEYVHTYSLIHDDLPCMDNDDYRRGNLSCHKKFGENVGLLAGDGLLTLAFGIIADAARDGFCTAQTAVWAAAELSAAAGYRGMIAGQAIDLAAEGKAVSIDLLREMDLLKTGALIKAACLLGCIAADADDELSSAAARYGGSIGLAFQITDDILDVTGSTETIGKPAGSDESNDKSTYVKLLGLERCRSLVNELTDTAIASLEVFPANKEGLSALALMLAKRDK